MSTTTEHYDFEKPNPYQYGSEDWYRWQLAKARFDSERVARLMKWAVIFMAISVALQIVRLLIGSAS